MNIEEYIDPFGTHCADTVTHFLEKIEYWDQNFNGWIKYSRCVKCKFTVTLLELNLSGDCVKDKNKKHNLKNAIVIADDGKLSAEKKCLNCGIVIRKTINTIENFDFDKFDNNNPFT